MVRGVLISGVSLKRGSTVHACNVRREGGGQGCPYFRGVLKEGFHCTHIQCKKRGRWSGVSLFQGCP